MIKIKIRILDEDLIELLEQEATFEEDSRACEYLQEIYDSNMQSIFDRLGKGKFNPGAIMAGCSSSYAIDNPHTYRYDPETGDTIETVYKKPLYDIAAKANLRRTNITIIHI